MSVPHGVLIFGWHFGPKTHNLGKKIAYSVHEKKT